MSFLTSVISAAYKSGISLYGFTRKREMFDANDDSFAETAQLENLIFGARAFHRFGYRDKLSVNFFAIREQCNRGNMYDYPVHQRQIGEVLTHKKNVAAITYDRYMRKNDLLSVSASSQFLNRDSYYGADYSTSDYRNSKDRIYNLGIQYKALYDQSTFVAGNKNTSGFLVNKKTGAPIFGDDEEGKL